MYTHTCAGILLYDLKWQSKTVTWEERPCAKIPGTSNLLTLALQSVGFFPKEKMLQEFFSFLKILLIIK